MPKITYVHQEQGARVIDVPVDTSVMLGAVTNDVDGIVAECGGNAQCATCHVYVEPTMLGMLPRMRTDEDEMLENTYCSREDNSRLSCQLRVTEDFEGLVVHLPDQQC